MSSCETTVETPTPTRSRRHFVKTGGTAVGALLVPSALPTPAAAARARPRWGFLIDLDACIGCKACAVACKTEFGLPLGVFRSSVKELEHGTYPDVKRTFVPWLCNQCKNPICTEVCPVDPVEATFTWPDGSTETYRKAATYQRPDGLVLVDQERCIACGQCVRKCPYGVRFLNPAKRATSPDAVGDHPAEKCDFCVDRLEAGLVPACVNTCQANARLIGDLNDPNSDIVKALKAKPTTVLLPELGTQPQCGYVSLHAATYTDGKDTRDEAR